MKKGIFLAILCLIWAVFPSLSWAADDSARGLGTTSQTLNQAAQIATNPTAYNTSFQVQPSYMNLEPSGNFSQLLLRLILPARGFFIPGLKVSDFFTLYRFEAPVGNIDIPVGSAFGLNDYTFTALAVKPGSDKLSALAFGGEAIFPTATNNLLGQGKTQLAPSVIAVTKKIIPNTLLGFFVQNFYSVGGQQDRPHLNYLDLQSIFTIYLPKAFFLSPNVQYVEDWTGNGGTFVELSFGLGRAFTKHLVITFTPQYIVTGLNKDATTYQLNFDYQGW